MLTMMTAVVLLLTFHRVIYASSSFQLIDLGGQWNFTSANKTVFGQGHVPGDVFTDLHYAGIIPDPLFGDNHLLLHWVSVDNWTYTRTFNIDKDTLKFNVLLLRLRGVDTVSSIIINHQLLINTTDQFVYYTANLSGILSERNMIEIRFISPVLYAEEKSSEYFVCFKSRGHLVPPVCPPSSYHGECHPNFIRKAQYSFSWDWGPALPSVGIWKPIDIVAFNDYFVDDFSWTIERTFDSWLVHGEVRVFTEAKSVKIALRIMVIELRIDQFESYNIFGGNKPAVLKFTLRIARDKVELWWPNGEGPQKLYTITVRSSINEITHRIGFRNVELVQNYVDKTTLRKGRHFYVKINDRPIFLKGMSHLRLFYSKNHSIIFIVRYLLKNCLKLYSGSNWIPVSMFHSNNTKRMEFLLDSAAEIGMNTLRVWGGGVYESDQFYDYADSKGILLWQDLMFACALYPTNDEFIENVSVEVSQQVWRIKRYSSVLLWAGNNENEIAIRGKWWQVENYTEHAQVEDYVHLYKDIIKPLVETADHSRPFLLSSPSNGVETEKEGGVSLNPGDPRFGDIHFYNYIIDLWDDNSYLIPRCATEFGVQSFPFGSTMLSQINISEWSYLSQQIIHRQHHPGGLQNNLIMVFSHFPIPSQCPRSLVSLHQCDYLMSPLFIDRFAYFSQAYQATTYKVQTEHYRRYRNRLLSSGLGNTMCALYWQLNDVWAAPTWSSIDTNLNWKMVHYEARRFMAPMIVVIYPSGFYDMGVSVVNDLTTKIINARLQIDMFAWTNRFEPVFSKNISVNISALSAEEVILNKFTGTWQTEESEFLLRALLFNEEDDLIAPEGILLPMKLYKAQTRNASIDAESAGDGESGRPREEVSSITLPLR
ncbi:glycoside hydrolase, family 2 [Dictyocaulus viviparus]|uniref:beta-mannosidase n=1 Tax=Dictyocaulus viviparus TaxID=29172 RepID=A0A0D8YAG8_DICVI|nr:glycoside hydrolase, family 2 [Dictyocaulus viviparus]